MTILPPVDSTVELVEVLDFNPLATPPVLDVGFGRGVSWGDYDGDGDQDLYLSNDGEPNQLFRNEGAGEFVDVTTGSLGDPGTGRAAIWGDYDNDGDLDLFHSRYSLPNILFRNEGGGAFVDATPPALAGGDSHAAAVWGDFDLDGDLDLFLGRQNQAPAYYRNEGDGSFVNATGAGLASVLTSRAAVAADFDNDGDLDLFLVRSSSDVNFRNDGDAEFVNVSSTALTTNGVGNSVAAGDYDNDGDLDVFVGNSQNSKLYRNEGDGAWVDATPSALAACEEARGAAWADYDQDGLLDLYVVGFAAGGDTPWSRLFRGVGSGLFELVPDRLLREVPFGGGLAWADVDGDGDLDFFRGSEGNVPRLFRNEVGSLRRWLHLKLEGTVSNRSGIGAQATVVTGSLRQMREVSGGSGYYSQESLPLEFGLGEATAADSVIVRWPSGIVQRLAGVGSDQVVTVVEEPGPSLPAAVLHPAVPNPFRSGTALAFEVREAAPVRLSIVDIRGREVRRVLESAGLPGGRYELAWDGRDGWGARVAAGVYLARLDVGAHRLARRVVLVP